MDNFQDVLCHNHSNNLQQEPEELDFPLKLSPLEYVFILSHIPETVDRNEFSYLWFELVAAYEL